MSEDAWVFDSLVCFLHGPVWNAPLQNFIEEKSLTFDPNDRSNVIDPGFVEIHNEYKNLVDYMLGYFMEEMQITPEQFEFACLEGRNTNTLTEASSSTGATTAHAFSFHQGLFQQIWAANDIRIFIRMMKQRNLELQLQALDLIERRSTPLYNSVEETEEVEDTKKENLTENEVVHKPAEEQKVDLEETGVDDKFKRLNLFFEQDKINAVDLAARQEHLRAQRDKILKIKKQARARQLNETVKKDGRPSSAKAAQDLLESGSSTDAARKAMAAGPSDASLQLRQTLARRLRSEVVDID